MGDFNIFEVSSKTQIYTALIFLFVFVLLLINMDWKIVSWTSSCRGRGLYHHRRRCLLLCYCCSSCCCLGVPLLPTLPYRQHHSVGCSNLFLFAVFLHNIFFSVCIYFLRFYYQLYSCKYNWLPPVILLFLLLLLCVIPV